MRDGCYNRESMIAENLQRVRERIAGAARSAGRDPTEIRLICVTKGVPVERIREAVSAGIREIGENRVQEAQIKKENLGTRYKVPGTSVSDLRWHMIGHLQRNKAKLAAGLFDWIHSVDSSELVQLLDQQSRKLKILVQVNVSGEATKEGCRPEELEKLAAEVGKSSNLTLAGLMTMAPFGEDPEAARPFFGKLRQLRDKLDPKLELSMGMSGDFEAAIKEGATMVRIGTAIFGERAQ